MNCKEDCKNFEKKEELKEKPEKLTFKEEGVYLGDELVAYVSIRGSMRDCIYIPNGKPKVVTDECGRTYISFKEVKDES